jgi:hypothetical protein
MNDDLAAAKAALRPQMRQGDAPAERSKSEFVFRFNFSISFRQNFMMSS